MRRKFWQTEKFKELQKEWALKLRESGFRDAEDTGKYAGKMLQKAFNCYRTQIPEIIQAKQRYFELLGQGSHQEKFEDEVDKYVMERRAEGISIKQIRMGLRAANKKNSTETVRKIIRFYEAKWCIKKRR